MQRNPINTEFDFIVSRLFDTIYQAAKFKNKETIQAILDGAYRFNDPCNTHPLSISLHHFTPIMYLAYEEDQESVDFLSQFYIDKKHELSKLEATVGYCIKHFPCELINFDMVGEFDLLEKNMIEFAVAKRVKINLTTATELLVKNFAQDINDSEEREELKKSRIFGIADSLVRQGMVDVELEKLILRLRWNVSSRSLVSQRAEYGVHYSKLMENRARFLPFLEILKGYAQANNLEAINDLNQYVQFHDHTQQFNATDIVGVFHMAGYLHHPEIVHALCFYINNKAIFDRIKIQIGENNNIKKMLKVIPLREKYDTDQFQTMALLDARTHMWILLGIQLVIREQLTPDLYLELFRYFSPLSLSEIKDIYQKIHFNHLHQTLNANIQSYLEPILVVGSEVLFKLGFIKRSHYHTDRASSFLTESENIKSLSELEVLLGNQFRLFTSKTVSKKASELKHDQLYVNQEKDEFTDGIEKSYEMVSALPKFR